MNLIVDIGNSSVKLAVFEQNKLLYTSRCEADNLTDKVREICIEYSKIKQLLVSSVVVFSDKLFSVLSNYGKVYVLNHNFKMPFKNLYKTPETLGLDRLALAAASIQQYPKKNTLIIDAGTCITYDFVDENANYFGGAISPGLQMRYKALHNQTVQLPLLQPSELTAYIGNTTETSIHIGVVYGIVHEIQGVISTYSSDYSDLTIILTGGDANFLCKQFKISIFANSNFLLEGLNFLLDYNYNS
jgi:type III pantothenate kinase